VRSSATESRITAWTNPAGRIQAAAQAIKPIYTAPSAERAQAELDAFEQGPWGRKFPHRCGAWRRAWDA